ncbi:hypothetical protein Tco_0623870 [Tanacetum coccineum]|uniref:Uncharacterized protein n=1 Tax=Tanacetum coccineum TaxID=301880 RepID=A0ABQ4WC91_9ASTR
MGDSTGVSGSLGGEIFLGGKKCQESNISDSDNTRDRGKIISGAIGAYGDSLSVASYACMTFIYCSTPNSEFLDPKKKLEIESWLEDSKIVDPLVSSDDVEYFDTFPALGELGYHEWLLKYPKPSWVKAKIRTENLNNIKISCMIGHFLKREAYINLESPINVMSKQHYKWIMSKGIESRQKPSNPARGDGVAGIKRRRHDLSSDGVRNLAMASGRGRLKSGSRIIYVATSSGFQSDTVIIIDIYSTVVASPNACEMWKAIEKLKTGVNQLMFEDIETNLYGSLEITLHEDGESLNSITIGFTDMNELCPIIRGTGYDHQRAVNVAGARENVGTPVVQKSGIQCYNCKEYGHDQADWIGLIMMDESVDQELVAPYMYMAQLQEVTPVPVDNSGPIFDDEPTHKVYSNITIDYWDILFMIRAQDDRMKPDDLDQK